MLSLGLKGTVSSLPNAKGDLFVQMGILRSQVNIRDLELLKEDDITAALGDGASLRLGSGSGSKSGKNIWAPAKGRGTGSGQIKMSKILLRLPGGQSHRMTVDEAMPVMEKLSGRRLLSPHAQCPRGARPWDRRAEKRGA